ncbi:MAG: NAD(P)H-hydrate dehydratase [Crocinitomicaceae bacterium]
MKIFNVKQIRDWDLYTIQNEPIASIDLMERAASNLFDRMTDRFVFNSYAIICGPGNNGGDGLVLARLLLDKDQEVHVFIPRFTDNYSEDFQKNSKRLPKEVIHYFDEKSIPDFSSFDCVIDALFGSGLTRPLSGFLGNLVSKLNELDAYRISVDIPSGLYADWNLTPIPELFFHADITYTFQVKKSSFFNEDIRKEIGAIEVIDIGLSEEYAESEATDLYEIEETSIELHESSRFTHKFEQGFALIVGGSRGKYGAPILSARAALKTGAGLVSVAIPEEGRNFVHTSSNELMVVDAKGMDYLESVALPEKLDAIGIGPGLGKSKSSIALLRTIFKSELPLVIDADALNLLAENSELMKLLPEDAILTPHPGEFERLFGKQKSHQERVEVLKQAAKDYRIVIVLKGAISVVASPDGELYFLDEVGNKGMATAGSGDVLTGIITSLLAQGYSSVEAAAYGVYVHGLSGDLCLEDMDYRSITASDLICQIGKALKNLAE